MTFNRIFERLALNKKTQIYILLLLAIGIFLIVSVSKVETYKTADNADVTTDEYSTYTENRLEYVLSQIRGVGKIEIIINTEYKRNSSTLFLEKTKNNSGSNEVFGVVAVAEGASDPKICYAIKTAVSGFLNIPLHKIAVYEML